MSTKIAPLTIGYIVGFLVCYLFVTPDSANAARVVNAETGQTAQPYQRWSNRTKLPTPDLTVTVYVDEDRMFTPCPDHAEACAIDDTVWVWSGSSRAVWLHELGHAVDHALLTPQDRFRFRRLVGDMRPWDVDEVNPPHEKFGEAYAFCARTGVRSLGAYVEWSSFYDYDPSMSYHKPVCALIRDVQRR